MLILSVFCLHYLVNLDINQQTFDSNAYILHNFRHSQKDEGGPQ